MSTDVKVLARSIQGAMFNARFNSIYHDLLCRRYERLDKISRIAVAFAVFILFVFGHIFPSHGKAWHAATTAIAMFSTSVLPLFRWSKLVPQIEAQRQRWIQLRQDYENLWDDVRRNHKWDKAEADFRRIRKRDDATEPQGGLIPPIQSLLNKAERAVYASRGITVA